ncbi:MAG: Rv3235 family protein [Rhodococcus sp. (in: high G+C Gram-positive bacteria)]|uniref:Rv3235 family protein n=1 Tax=Rhodococcus sp. TaxID=1831 RepID=UPI003BB0C2FF
MSPRPGNSSSSGAAHCAPPDAQRFIEHAFRLVLEVLDRRRNAQQLRPLVAAPLVDVVRTLALASSPARRLGVATLRRVHLRPLDSGKFDCPAAEAFGTYGRGSRVFVIAARVEKVPATGWTITSLVIG